MIYFQVRGLKSDIINIIVQAIDLYQNLLSDKFKLFQVRILVFYLLYQRTLLFLFDKLELNESNSRKKLPH
tara:strand:- start:122 stop:334 length:213 start_codon:yes stop_codon:yes gene_type:complete